MHVEKQKLGSMAWYRLTMVVYFVLLSVAIIVSILITFTLPYVGIGALVLVGLIAEMSRQLFFYVVTGEFLSKQYKEKLIEVSKVFAAMLVVVLIIILTIKGLFMLGAAMCNSKLGSLGTYENGTCECTYGYTLENDSCVSNEEICQRSLGENAVSIA